MALAVLNKNHPDANYLNMDTMFSYTPRNMPIVEALISAFIVGATTPKYFRAVTTIIRGAARGTTQHKALRAQKRHAQETFANFGMKPVGGWYDFPTRRHTGIIATCVFLYNPCYTVEKSLALQHQYADELNRLVSVSPRPPKETRGRKKGSTNKKTRAAGSRRRSSRHGRREISA